MSEPGQCNCGEYGGGVHTYSARCLAADKAYCESQCAWKGGGACLYEYCPRLKSQADADCDAGEKR
jgi:hypothetical protein